LIGWREAQSDAGFPTGVTASTEKNIIISVFYDQLYSELYFDWKFSNSMLSLLNRVEIFMDEDQEDCMGRIEPLFRPLDDALRHGMAFYRNNYSAEVVAQQRDRTAANCVYDHSFHRIRELLDQEPGCHFLSVRGLEVLNYYDLAVLRLKKVDGAGRWRNFQTPQQRDFDRQLPLPGLPAAAVRLVVGYEPDAAFTTVERIIVSRPFVNTIRWAAQIVVLDDNTSWLDITPARIAGTERVDFRAGRRR
jgi:hypothetical protein